MEINPLSVASFTNIFSHSESCLFILFMVSFAVQKLLSFMRSHLFIFAFVSFALGDRCKKYCYNLCQSAVLMFSSRSITVSSLIFKPLIHFEFIFVYNAKECGNFILFNIVAQISQYQLLKKLSFLHCLFLPPLS